MKGSIGRPFFDSGQAQLSQSVCEISDKLVSILILILVSSITSNSLGNTFLKCGDGGKGQGRYPSKVMLSAFLRASFSLVLDVTVQQRTGIPLVLSCNTAEWSSCE